MIQTGARLPDLSLREGTASRPLADRRRSPVVVVLHDPTCPGCLAYLRSLALEAEEIAAWDGAVRPVVGGGAEPALGVDLPWPVLSDPDDRVRRRAGLAPGRAGLLVADRWGQLWLTGEASCAKDLPGTEDVKGALRFIGLQCPECNTLDSPVPSW